MAVGDVGLLRVVGQFQDQNIVNTLHYLVESQSIEDAFLWDTFLLNWQAEIQNEWNQRHSSAYLLSGLTCHTAFGDTKPPGALTINQFGDVTGDPQESFICRTITLYPTQNLPKSSGRVMLSGGIEEMFDDTTGAVTADEIAILDTFGALLLEDIQGVGGTFQLVLFNQATKTVDHIARAKGRVTPSVVRSRRVKRFLVG